MATRLTGSSKSAAPKPPARSKPAPKASAKKVSSEQVSGTAKSRKAEAASLPASEHTEVATDGTLGTAADQVDEQLARYRSMRDFNVTAEPAGGNVRSATGLPFVVQKHRASHLHYDFRLGWNGVLKSWACAKGPSYVVKDKRLAVQVEDHPIEYGGFEGIIPAGQYGGGTVMVWDQGTWAPQAGHEDVDAGLRDGQLKFVLHGTKLQGKWALIRMGGRAAQEKKPNWLLIKEHDDLERGPEAPVVTEAQPDSAVTGRSLDQIASSEDHVWNSKETAGPGQAWTRKEPAAAHDAQPGEPEAPAPVSIDLAGLPTELQPSFVKPQLAQEAATPPEGTDWLHELKLDGYRVQARKSGREVRMLTRSGLDWTDRMRQVAGAVARLPVETVTLDGEVVVVAENGTTSFADLQASFQEGAKNPLTFFCFDLLHIEGHNPRGKPLRERKQMLATLLAGTDASSIVQLSEHLEANGAAMFQHACELHAEGIISKRANGPYTDGRTSAWLKCKCLHEQEFVIGGYTLPAKGGPGLGALLLGYYDGPAPGGKLIYAGRTGTGFTQKFAVILRKRLETAETSTSPFANPEAEARRGAIWVRPSTVAQVRFATWTADLQVRQAAFLGLREDKAAIDVRRETAAPTPKSDARKQVSPPPPEQPPAAPERAPVRLTHPAKVLDESTGVTKQQLADFYWAVSPRMLPHIAGRPLSLVRCPEGSEKPCFYQKHVNHTLPPGVGSIDLADKKGKVEPYITLETREALAGLAQLGVLEIHPWGSTTAEVEHPDRIVIDLDPDESLPWATLTTAARDVRDRMATLGLETWVKTTGGKGLHVVLPLAPSLGWAEAKDWAHGFVERMERASPTLYLTKMTKAARAGRIYLDYLRNERGATAVAPYSPRARRGTGVAVPLAWQELDAKERPEFRIANFADWQQRLSDEDVWAGMAACAQTLSAEARRAGGLKPA